MIDKRFFSHVDACHYLGISDRALCYLVERGDMQIRYFGKKRLYDRLDLDAFALALPAEAARA